MDRLLADLFLDGPPAPPETVPNLDGTDISLQVEQEERVFYGYCRKCCCMPRPVFRGRTPFWCSCARRAKTGQPGWKRISPDWSSGYASPGRQSTPLRAAGTCFTVPRGGPQVPMDGCSTG